MYRDSSASFRASLDTVILFLEHGVFPHAGGLLDQPSNWYEDLKTFKGGREYWHDQQQKIKEGLKALGAYRGK